MYTINTDTVGTQTHQVKSLQQICQKNSGGGGGGLVISVAQYVLDTSVEIQ